MIEEFATDVLICGAGAAGLTLAIDLARRGIAFRLIDRAEHPFNGSRGKGIQPRTLEILEDLGILDRVAALGGPYPPQRVYRSDGSHADSPLAEASAPTPAEPYGMPLMLPQFLTEKILRDRLLELGHRVEFGVTLSALSQDSEGVTATLSGTYGETQVQARYLAASDGGRSTVRHLLGIDFPGKTLNVRAVAADVTLTGLDRDAWHRYNDGDMARQIMICPLAGTALFQIQAPIALDGDVDLSVQGLDAMVKNRVGRADITVHDVSWASAYGMNARLAGRYRAGRVFLVGDAAHIHPPTGGQGLNTSIQDAYNLGWKLAAVLGGADDALLDTYETERRPIAAAVLGLSTALLDAARRGDFKRGRNVRQLDLAYADSPLSLSPRDCPGRVRPGDRAPDAPLRGAGGQATRLFTLFRGPHWTLLGCEAKASIADSLRRPGLHYHAIGAGGDVADADGHFKAAYGVADGTMILIRPDGHVAAVAGPADAEALDAYLRRVGLRALASAPPRLAAHPSSLK